MGPRWAALGEQRLGREQKAFWKLAGTALTKGFPRGISGLEGASDFTKSHCESDAGVPCIASPLQVASPGPRPHPQGPVTVSLLQPFPCVQSDCVGTWAAGLGDWQPWSPCQLLPSASPASCSLTISLADDFRV